jgi:aldehyde:ferredoxin oxidoreductase
MSGSPDCGYAGQILRVNLSEKRVRMQPTAEAVVPGLGGRGINSWALWEELDPKTDWRDPGNLLCFGAGILVGTLAGGACRVSVDSKNAFNNGIGSANMGGFWGAELKYAGFDAVLITGKPEEPVYLWICDGRAEIRDASCIWGMTTWDTETFLRHELGDERVRVASIGPAGENQVRSACIICDRACAAGGSGLGAVMGAKKLKAIAVRGRGGVRLADPDRFMAAVNEEMRHVNGWDFIHAIREKGYYGALGGSVASSGWDQGYRPVRNGQDDYWSRDKVAEIAEEKIQAYRVGTVACHSCPISCKPWLRIPAGPCKIQGEGWWNNSANAFCTKIDSTDLETAVYAHHMANQLGLDMDNAAQAIAWAFECYQKGLLTREDTGGLELRWGNGRALPALLESLAHRRGIGDLLADGALRAAGRLGRGSEEFVIHIKGQDSLDGVRINKGWGLGIAVSTASGRHLRGSLNGFWLKKDRPITSYVNVPEDLYLSQQRKGVQDILGMCSYVYGQTLSDWVSLYTAATGQRVSEQEMLAAGLKLHNIEKAFNTLHCGFTREDDYPCPRYYNEPVGSGPYRGERIDHEEYDRMLDRLYQLHGWDRETGWQTRAGLESIGLTAVADKLERAGKLAANPS